MAIALGERVSTAALPTGQVKRVLGQGGGSPLAWPATGYLFHANAARSVPMQVYTFTAPTRYYLCAKANLIMRSIQAPGAWTSVNYALRLTDDTATPVADLEGKIHLEKYDSFSREGGEWKHCTISATYYCEAFSRYYVELVGWGVGIGTAEYYTGYDGHLSLVAYTIGEGVY